VCLGVRARQPRQRRIGRHVRGAVLRPHDDGADVRKQGSRRVSENLGIGEGIVVNDRLIHEPVHPIRSAGRATAKAVDRAVNQRRGRPQQHSVHEHLHLASDLAIDHMDPLFHRSNQIGSRHRGKACVDHAVFGEAQLLADAPADDAQGEGRTVGEGLRRRVVHPHDNELGRPLRAGDVSALRPHDVVLTAGFEPHSLSRSEESFLAQFHQTAVDAVEAAAASVKRLRRSGGLIEPVPVQGIRGPHRHLPLLGSRPTDTAAANDEKQNEQTG